MSKIKQKYIDNPVRTFVPHLKRWVGIGGKITLRNGEVIPKADAKELNSIKKWNPAFFESETKQDESIPRRKEPVTESDTGSEEA